MKKNSLVLGLGVAASLLTTPIFSTGCATTQGASESHKEHKEHKECTCKMCDGKKDAKDCEKCGCKMKMKGKMDKHDEGSCSEGGCAEGMCGAKKKDG